MRAYIILTLVLLSLSTCKKRTDGDFIIHKNCTGTYLTTLDEKEYRVCNEELFYDYKSDEKVSVRYYFVDHDKTCEVFHCEMLYPFDETIVVTKIK